MRNQNTDIFQGGLVMMVVLGNGLSGVSSPGDVCNFISVCSLPMMAAVAGFRMNLPKMARSGGLDLKRRGWPTLWNKILKHWMVALAVFSLLSVAIGTLPPGVDERFSAINLASHILYPFFHLWFTLTISACMLVNGLLVKLNFKGWSLFFFNTLVGIVLGIADAIVTTHPAPPLIMRLPVLLNPSLLCYFGMGVAARRMIFDGIQIRHIPRRWSLLLGAICCGCLWLAYDQICAHDLREWQFVLLWPLLFALFICFVSRFLSDAQDIYDEGRFVTKTRQRVELTEARETAFLIACETLSFAGRNDVMIYVWHVLPIFAIQVLANEGYIVGDMRQIVICSFYIGWLILCVRLRNITKEL